MGSIVGGITDAIGLTNHAGEKKAAASAAEANAQGLAMSKEQIALAKEELQFQKDQYTDWKNIYGDIQENLGSYYKNLTPDKLVTLGLENQQKEFQQVQASIKRDFAQRGLAGSGQENYADASNKMSNAVARATIRTNADATANAEKMKFLSLGLGQGTEMLGQINNASNIASNAYSSAVNSRTNIANSYLNRANTLGAANMAAMSDLVSAGAYIGAK